MSKTNWNKNALDYGEGLGQLIDYDSSNINLDDFKIEIPKLFKWGEFKSHAGLSLKWKIECDALTKEDWDCLAGMIMEYETRSFGSVEGIPRGGVPLANALKKYITKGPPMIVDDIYTTGKSFDDYTYEHYRTMSFDYNPKWVVFARNKIKDRSGVQALFRLPGN